MVFDLDALKLEETSEPFHFKFGGQDFVFPNHYDPRVMRRLRTGDLGGGLFMLLGEEQFNRLDAIEQPFDERHLEALIQAWAAHAGTTPGEAKASSRSSKSTGRPSKRTSNGTTPSPSPK